MRSQLNIDYLDLEWVLGLSIFWEITLFYYCIDFWEGVGS